MTEKASLEFRLTKIDETRNYLLEEIKLITWWMKNIKRHLGQLFHNYWLCSISALASLVCVPGGITSSAVGLKICAIIVRIKKYKSVIKKKKKKKHDEIVLLGKTKLSAIEILISTA